MTKIFLTGGAGFIGSHLAKRLADDGHHVIVLDNLLRGNKIEKSVLERIEFVKGDVRDKDLVLKHTKGCDVIIHFAAVLGVDVVADNPVETMEVETLGMMNMASAATLHSIPKIMYASTSGIYGHSAMEKAVTETIIVDPRTSYAMAKRFNEIYLASLHDEKGIDTISLRFFNVFGPRQDNRMVVPRFFEQALAGEPITVFGSGKQTRDFTYIDDTITACVQLIKQVKGSEIFNIANEKERTIEDLAICIKKITNSSSPIQFIEAPKKRYDYEVERRVGSSDKLFKTINYKPGTSLEDGLLKIYKEEFQRAN